MLFALALAAALFPAALLWRIRGGSFRIFAGVKWPLALSLFFLAGLRPLPAAPLLVAGLAVLLVPALRIPPLTRETVTNLALFIASCAATLLLCEFGLRLFYTPQDAVLPLLVPHARRVHMLAPSGEFTLEAKRPDGTFSTVVKTNALGIRDKELAEKAPGELRLLMLGDSFVMGWGLAEAETIPRQLESILRERNGNANINVINAGIFGYGPWQSRDLLNEIGWRLQSDAVVLGLYPGNDVEDMLDRDQRFLEAYDPQAKYYRYSFYEQAQWQPATERWLRRNVYLLGLITDATGWPPRGSIARFLNRVRLTPPSGIPVFPAPAPRPPYLEMSLREFYPAMREGIDLLSEEVQKIRDDCAARDVPFLAALLPGRYEAQPEALTEDIAATGADPQAYESASVYTSVFQVVSAQVPAVSLLNPMRAAGAKEALFFPADSHPNARGAAVMAAALAEAIASDDRFRAFTGAQ